MEGIEAAGDKREKMVLSYTTPCPALPLRHTGRYKLH